MSDSIVRSQSLVSEARLSPIALPEKPQQIAHQQNHKHCTKPYACTSTGAPPAVTVVSSAQAEHQHQNNDENEHFRYSFLSPDYNAPSCITDLIAPGVSSSTIPSMTVLLNPSNAGTLPLQVLLFAWPLSWSLPEPSWPAVERSRDRLNCASKRRLYVHRPPWCGGRHPSRGTNQLRSSYCAELAF